MTVGTHLDLELWLCTVSRKGEAAFSKKLKMGRGHLLLRATTQWTVKRIESVLFAIRWAEK